MVPRFEECFSFPSAKKLVAFAGLDPIISQSGKFENITGPISKRGLPELRYALFKAANIARKTDEILMKFYNKKIGEGKHHFSALNATAAKILRIVFWVLKNDKEYKVTYRIPALTMWVLRPKY